MLKNAIKINNQGGFWLAKYVEEYYRLKSLGGKLEKPRRIYTPEPSRGKSGKGKIPWG